MATNANPLQPTDSALAAAVAAELAKQDAALRTGAGLPTNQPVEVKPWKIKQGNQELTFTSQDELQRHLDNQQAFFDQQLTKLAGQTGQGNQAGQGQQGDDPTPAPDPADGVNPKFKKFAERVVEDPSAAIIEAFEEKYGRNFFDTLGASAVRTQEIATRVELDQFVRGTADYEPTEQNAKAIQAIMEAYKMPVTAANLDLAWGFAKGKGVAQPRQQQQSQGFQQQTGYPQSSPFQAPPHLGRGAGADADPLAGIMDRIHELPKDKLMTLINQFNRQGG